jgi:hypothetical protein
MSALRRLFKGCIRKGVRVRISGFERCHFVVGDIAALQAAVFILSDTQGVAHGLGVFQSFRLRFSFFYLPFLYICFRNSLRSAINSACSCPRKGKW